MFTAAGRFAVVITDVKMAIAKFAKGPEAYDICIQVQNKENSEEADWWRGEMSHNLGKGKVSHLTQMQLTMMSLEKVGFVGVDISTINQQLVGKETTASIKATIKDGVTYYNVRYIGDGGGGDSPVELDPADLASRMQMLAGNVAQPVAQPVMQPVAQPATPAVPVQYLPAQPVAQPVAGVAQPVMQPVAGAPVMAPVNPAVTDPF